MLFDLERRNSLLTISLLVSLLLAVGASCTVNELPVQVSPPKINHAVSDNITPPAVIDIKSFAAQPKTIKLDENTVLAWKVDGASSLSIDPAIGSVTGNTGNVSVSPRETTLYTLRASDGRNEISAKFLVIVKTAEGTIIWPNSGSDNTTAEPLYEGWSYYPNKYVEWKITDRYGDLYEKYTCGHIGYITNNNTEWMMTEVTVGAADALPQVITNDIFNMSSLTPNNRVVLDHILPGSKSGYTTSMDCLQLPELKWKWKVYK